MRFTAVVGLCLLAVATADAQQKFTTQVMIVPSFSGADRGAGRKAADAVRGKVAGAFPRSELKVISGGDVDAWLKLSGFDDITNFSEGELHDIASKFRADERITGTVSQQGGRFHIEGDLSLIRDLRLSQPLVGDGSSVGEAAAIVAQQAIDARRQFPALRQCENLSRDGKHAEAAAAAVTGIVAYAPAVPARLCLITALVNGEAKPDTIIAVAKKVLEISPKNSIALGALADALDAEARSAEAAPIWQRLVATDTMNAEMLDHVVSALSREGSAEIAQPLIDRGTTLHPDNLRLLKLRWLVHLAAGDWKGAVGTGEELLARDAATQADPDFYSRLAAAYKADSQPMHALAIAATGVSKFPNDAPLYMTYLQLLKTENDAALTRGLSAFPESPELHAFAAQMLKTAGNAAGALEETKRALAANPRLPHGYLQLAQLEMELGAIDSAYAALELAPSFGESPSLVAQYALARGNDFYKAASASQKRDDYQRAIKFLALATRIGPTPESHFLLGASALSVSQSAAMEAKASKSCELTRLAGTSLTDAEMNLISGGSVAPDAAKQYLDYVAKLRPYVAEQVKNLCGGGETRS